MSRSNEFIDIKGARSHNLKNINLKIKKNAISCLAGPSGSGKSSLAYHTLYAESKRRFLNSISNSEKFFWDIPKTADVDLIEPILPVWALAQYNPVMGSRFNVGDILQLTEHLQAFMFHAGRSFCPECNIELGKNSFSAQIEKSVKSIEDNDVIYLFTSFGEYTRIFPGQFPQKGWSEKKSLFNLKFGEDEDELDCEYVLFQRVKRKNLHKLLEEIKRQEKNIHELYLKMGEGEVTALKKSSMLTCPSCSFEIKEIDDVRYLSPINALGACESCEGHGANLSIDRAKVVRDNSLSINQGAVHVLNYVHFQHFLPRLVTRLKKQGFDPDVPFSELREEVWDIIEQEDGTYPGTSELFKYLDSKKYKKSVRIYLRGFKSETECLSCEGTRINSEALDLSISHERKLMGYKDLLKLSIGDLQAFLNSYKSNHKEVLKMKKAMVESLGLAIDLGLDHLGFIRKLKSISGSEYQRLLLVKYMGHQTSDSFYILDEPSLGLGENFQRKILKHLKELTKRKNTVLLVEHSPFFHNNCDEIIELGPEAGERGGEVIYQGKPKQKKNYKLELEWVKKKPSQKIKIKNVGASYIPRKSFDVSLGVVNWIHGDPGTGKTSYFIYGLANELSYYHQGKNLFNTSIDCDEVIGMDKVDDVYYLDSNLGRVTSRSTVGTYVGLSPFIRKIYAATKDSRSKGLRDGDFSSNSSKGQCPECQGAGKIVVDLQYFEDVIFKCEVCEGRKIKDQAAFVEVKGIPFHKAIDQEMNSVIPHFELTSKANRIYDYLTLLKINYLSLGRELNSLSGGERQRLKLFSLLQKKISNSIIFFENLSFGLSMRELESFSLLFENLRNDGNTLVVIDNSNVFSQMCDVEIKIST
jgi:excinuclease ABC subunit A